LGFTAFGEPATAGGARKDWGRRCGVNWPEGNLGDEGAVRRGLAARLIPKEKKNPHPALGAPKCGMG